MEYTHISYRVPISIATNGRMQQMVSQYIARQRPSTQAEYEQALNIAYACYYYKQYKCLYGATLEKKIMDIIN